MLPSLQSNIVTAIFVKTIFENPAAERLLVLIMNMVRQCKMES